MSSYSNKMLDLLKKKVVKTCVDCRRVTIRLCYYYWDNNENIDQKCLKLCSVSVYKSISDLIMYLI